MERIAQRAGRMNTGYARAEVKIKEARWVRAFVRLGEKILYMNTEAEKGAKVVMIVRE